MTDHNSGLHFLVDTGAEASFPLLVLQQDGPDLQAVNGTPIATYGRRSLTLNLGIHCTGVHDC